MLPLNGERSSLCRGSGDFGDAEASDRYAHQVDAVVQGVEIEREALNSRLYVCSDLGQKHASEAHGEPVQNTSRRDNADAHEPEQHEHAVIGRPEHESHSPKQWGEPGEDDDGDRTAYEAGYSRREQGKTGLPLQRQLVTIDASDDAACMGDLHSDGADAVAVLRPVVDAGEHDQRAVHGKRIGERQEQTDSGQRPQAGQQPHQRADHASDRAVHQVLQGQRVLEPHREVLQNIHQ